MNSILIDAILLFRNTSHPVNEYITKFVNIMKLAEPNSLEKLIEIFCNNIEAYSSLKEIKQLFELRVNWLNGEIKEVEKKYHASDCAEIKKQYEDELDRVKNALTKFD